MAFIRRFFQRLLTFIRFDRAETNLAREIDAHLQLLEDEHVARGMSRDDARLAARRSFGGVEQAKSYQRDARSFRWLEDSRSDAKLAVRMLAKYPGLSLIGGAGLAIGLAVGTAFFAFYYSYMFATLPVENGDRIVALENWDIEKNNEMRQSMHDLRDWRRDMKTVEEIGAFRTIGRNLIIPGASTEPIQIAQITPTAFNLARVPPLLGRPLIASDQAIGAAPVIVIGYQVWQSRFGSDTSIVGRDIRIGNIVHTVVGVMPDGFAYPVNHQYWTPLSEDTSTFARGGGPAVFIFGRLRDGVSMAQAQSELSAIGARAAAAYPSTHARLQPRVWPFVQPILDIQGMTTIDFAILQAAVSLLLVVVAINVAILVYARTATRQGEIAVRTALGAGRSRIVGQLFIEALVLSIVAGGAGLLLAKIGLQQGHAIMAAEGAMVPYFINFGIPPVAMLYAAGLAVLAALIAGVVPALHATSNRLHTTLRQLGGSDGLRLGKTWTGLVIAQVALAVAMLPAAISLGWGEVRGAMTAAAYDEERFIGVFVTMDPDAPAGVSQEDYTRDSTQRLAKLRADLVAKLESEPAVADVTTARALPGDESRARVEIDGATLAGNSIARFNQVAADFFDAFDTTIVAGRALNDSDGTPAAAPAVIVNRAFVTQMLGGGSAIGRRIRYLPSAEFEAPMGDTTTEYEIVGVVSDLQTNATNPELVDPVIFHRASPDNPASALIIRMRGADAEGFTGRLRDVVGGLDPAARVRPLPFTELRRQQMLAVRLMVLALSLIFASVLLLSAGGLYALMSFTVSQRKKEIGIRAAMGADARQLLWSIFARSAFQLVAGITIGAGVAMMLDVASAGEMLGPTGRALLGPMALVMLIVGLIAAVGPARRGLRVHPTEALRAE